jgi:hypothetical protein
MKPRIVYISRDPESIDPDKLTHIALFQYHADKNPMKFIEAEHVEKLIEHIGKLERALECAINEAALGAERDNGAEYYVARLRKKIDEMLR